MKAKITFELEPEELKTLIDMFEVSVLSNRLQIERLQEELKNEDLEKEHPAAVKNIKIFITRLDTEMKLATMIFADLVKAKDTRIIVPDGH